MRSKKSRAYAKPQHQREQDKNVATVFNKVEVKETGSFRSKRCCGKVMKQNEKIDERFGIKASNLQSINCMNVFGYELDTKRLTL